MRDHAFVLPEPDNRALRRLLCAGTSAVWIRGVRGAELRRVLVAIDPNSPDEGVASEAVAVASELAATAQAELFAVAAWTASGEALLAQHVSSRQACAYVAAVRQRATETLRRVTESCAVQIDARHRICRRGRAERVIAHAISELGIDVVVLGMAPRPRAVRVLCGSTALRVARRVMCHVLVLNDHRAPITELPRAIALRVTA